MADKVANQIKSKLSEIVDLLFGSWRELEQYLKKRDLTMCQAAVLVLFDKQEWMRSEDIWNEVVRRELYRSTAKNPVQVFTSQLNWDIKKHPDDPRFVLRDGRYGLPHFLESS